jgi:hypothetical protein
VTALEVVQAIENAGGALKLAGDRVRYQLPEGAAPLVEALRTCRAEVIRVLQQREWAAQSCYVHTPEATWWTRSDGSKVCGLCHPEPRGKASESTKQSPPQMPSGVRLREWRPKKAPVVVTVYSVVGDVQQFVRATLAQLGAALDGKPWLAGNYTVRDLQERLEQVGVKVEIMGAE